MQYNICRNIEQTVKVFDERFAAETDRLHSRADAEYLLTLAAQKDVGVMIIKSVTRAPWGERTHTYKTWYEPFDAAAAIEQGIGFVLSQPVTAFASPADVRLLPMVIEATENFRPLSADEQKALVESASAYQPLFTPGDKSGTQDI